MKFKKLIPFVIILSFFLVSCKKNDNAVKDTPKVKTENTVPTDSENTDPTKEGEVTTGENNENSENVETPQTPQKETKEVPKNQRELLKSLVDGSDYISRIRVSQDNNGELIPIFIEDYKGDLSYVEYELPKGLNSDEEYLLFLKDGENGLIEPTDIEHSYMQIAKDSDSNLSYIERTFKTNQRVDKKISD